MVVTKADDPKKKVTPRMNRYRRKEFEQYSSITGLTEEDIAEKWLERERLLLHVWQTKTPTQSLIGLVTYTNKASNLKKIK